MLNEFQLKSLSLASARCARIGKDWNGSSIPRKGNIGDTHFNVEPATPHVVSAEKTT
jgi:hypothetical protein